MLTLKKWSFNREGHVNNYTRKNGEILSKDIIAEETQGKSFVLFQPRTVFYFSNKIMEKKYDWEEQK